MVNETSLLRKFFGQKGEVLVKNIVIYSCPLIAGLILFGPKNSIICLQLLILGGTASFSWQQDYPATGSVDLWP